MSRVPQETIDVIVSNIDDLDTLRILGLVNHAFLVPSRRRAFASIIFDGENALSFITLLSNRHCTFKYCLGTTLILGDLVFEDAPDSDSIAPGKAWLHATESLPPDSFSFVRELHVDFGYYDYDVSLDLLKAHLPRIFPHTTALTFLWWSYDCIIEIAESASRFRHLEKLTVGRSDVCAVDPSPDPDYVLPPPPETLKEVVVLVGVGVTETLLAWLAKSTLSLGLEVLELPQLSCEEEEDIDDSSNSLETNEARNRAIEEYLPAFHSSLKQLRLEMYRDHCMDSVTQHIDWTTFTSLVSFTFTYTKDTPSAALLALLRNMQSLSSLRCIRLIGPLPGGQGPTLEDSSDATSIDDQPDDDAKHEPHASLLTTFDELFALPNFKYLQTLELASPPHLSIFGEGSSTTARAQYDAVCSAGNASAMRSTLSLPICVARGILRLV